MAASRSKLVSVRLPIYTTDEKLAPPASEVQEYIEYGKPLIFNMGDQFGLHASDCKPGNELICVTTKKKWSRDPIVFPKLQEDGRRVKPQAEIEEEEYEPDEDAIIESLEVYGRVGEMIDFLNAAPVALPNEVPLYYYTQTNLNMFNLQHNKLSQQSATGQAGSGNVADSLENALSQFFSVRPVATANMLYILFTNMKFAKIHINGVEIVQCTGNQLKSALYKIAKFHSDHWYSNQEVMNMHIQSILLERPRRKNQLMHKEELRSLLDRDFSLGWGLSDDMKMQLSLLGRGNYFAGALHSDAYNDFKSVDKLIHWFCDQFQNRVVGLEEDVRVFKELSDVIQSPELYDMFLAEKVPIVPLDLRIEYLARCDDEL